MMKKVTPNVDPRFAQVVGAFARDRQVSYGKMFASMGLKINGKIFAMHVKGRFVAKLPRERVDDTSGVELARKAHAW
jgi:TfoX/Sxy family transcriptional regulator of competence genes